MITITKKEDVGEETLKSRTLKVSPKSISGVVAGAGTRISPDALHALLSEGVVIAHLRRGEIFALTMPYNPHGTVKLRKDQYLAASSKKGLHVAARIVEAGMVNKARLLQSLSRNREHANPSLSDRLGDHARRILELRDPVRRLMTTNHFGIEDHRFQLMGYEGEATALYYSALSEVFPAEWEFKERTKRPPRDPVNSALSYGYVILVARMITMVVASGLDPFCGFLHADRSGRRSLAIDLAETFRQPIVDRAVLELCLRNEFQTDDDFDEENGAVYLNASGKKKLISKLEERLNQEFTYKSSKTTYLQRMMSQVTSLKRYLLGNVPQFDPFMMRW